MINILPINIKYLITLEILSLILLFSLSGFFKIALNDFSKMGQHGPKYQRIFWIAFFVQGFIGCMLLKYHLSITDTDIVINFVIDNSTEFTLTVNGKIAYFFYYLEMSMELTTINAEDRIMLRYMVQQIDLKILIEDKTTINDIKIYIDRMIDNYLQYVAEKNQILPRLYIIFKYIVITGAVTTAVISMQHFYAIFTQLQNPMELSRIATKMIEGNPSKITLYKLWEFLGNLKYELYDVVDLFLFDGIPLQIKIIFIGIYAMVSGTYLLPSLVHSLETHFNQSLQKDSVIFLDDLPVVSYGTHNLFTLYFYYIGALCLVFSMIICIKVLYNRKKKSTLHEAINQKLTDHD